MNRFRDINIKLLLFFLICIGLQHTAYTQKKNEKFVLVLDAGHGGKDPGARGVVEDEKYIALDVVLRLGKLIEDHYKDDVKVIYTRRDDTFLELSTRANIANQHKADFFVSIHCNAARPTAYGTETFVLGTEPHRSDDNFSIVKKENSVILLEENHEEKYQGFDPTSPESVIGLTLMQNVHLENSLKFADQVEKNFVNKDKRFSRGVKQAGFLVLWRTATPSVLIELGFISNPEEGRYLASIEGKKNSAESIFNAFKTYKREWDIKRGHTIKENAPVIVDKKEEKKAEAESPVEGTKYKIQFLTSSRKYRPTAPQLKGLKPVEIVKDGKVYKYYYGETNYISKRDANLNRVKRAGFPDAFVVEIQDKKSASNTKETSNTTRNEGYRIQILTSQKNYDAHAPQMKGVKPVDKFAEGGLYRYYFGWFDTEAEARNALPNIKTRGFADAFIVKFKNGKKE
ncbi:MAG: N-acetylmuramoyl-L-alanine amidase [Flavobacteriaceae bacterium]|nr:N-acetylmuramoyl-L-alanine amidase [Flavobacteriaceae bacterium]